MQMKPLTNNLLTFLKLHFGGGAFIFLILTFLQPHLIKIAGICEAGAEHGRGLSKKSMLCFTCCVISRHDKHQNAL